MINFIPLLEEVSHLPSISTLIVPFIIILLLVLLNGFFVMAEFSIISARTTQLEPLAEDGNKAAAATISIIESRQKQDKYIATAQLGITIASLGLAMYAEPQIAHFITPYLEKLLGGEVTPALLHTISYIIALSVLTYLHVVIGEMIPKSLALSHPTEYALKISKSMTWARLVLSIPVRALTWIGNMLLRLFRVPLVSGEERIISPDEIELLVTESVEGGLLNAEEEELIRNIFDFGERTIGQVMTPRPKVIAIPHDMPPQELFEFVSNSRHSRFPVYEGDLDHIIGLLHLKDVARQVLKGGAFDLRIMLRPLPAVPEDYLVENMLAAFKRDRRHMGIALDEYGGMAGIVTLEDLVEEVMGEVRDEFDDELEPFVKRDSGIIEVAGDYLVDDLIDEIDLGDPEELPNVDTVGGLIVTWLGDVPKEGDDFTYNNNHFIVTKVERRAIVRARIEYPEHDDE